MSLLDRIRRTAIRLLGGEVVSKALPPKVEKLVETYGMHDIGQHRSPIRHYIEPGGKGPRKFIGFDAPTLRSFARMNPWLRAVIDIRKREVASCDWDIVPALEHIEKEMNTLRKLVQSVNRFDDRVEMLDAFKPQYIPPKVVKDLLAVTLGSQYTPSEVRYRFSLALGDMYRVAEQHAAKVRPLFEQPSEMPMGWSQILTAAVPDLLILDAMAVEKRRLAKPEKDGWPLHDNQIVSLIAVDGATVRPVIDEYGMLAGIRDKDSNEVAYEQWIDNRRIDAGGWRACDLMYLQENPQTDIEFRGYGYSRVESLAMTCVLESHADKEDLEEYKRGMYGGFLVFHEDGLDREDMDDLRVVIEEELEGTRKLPIMTTGKDGKVEWISTSQFTGNRDKKAETRTLRLIKRICAMFEIPLTKLAEHAAQTNYATSKTTQEQADDGLRKLLGFLDDAITRHIVTDFGYSDIKYSSDPQHNRDKKEELELVKQRLELGIWEINDARMDQGEDPIEEGDISYWRWSEGQKEMGRAEGQQAGQPQGQEGGGDGAVGPDGQPVEGEGGGQEGGEGGQPGQSDPEGDGEDLDGDGIEQSDQIEDHVGKALGHKPETHLNPYVEHLMGEFGDGLYEFWQAMQPDIEQAVSAGGLGWIAGMDDILQQRQADLDVMVRRFIDNSFGYGATTATLGEAAINKPVSPEQMQAWAQANPGYVSSEAMQYLQASAFTEAKARQQHVMDSLKQAILQGVQQGGNPVDIARRYTADSGSTLYSDYERIARTETAKAFAVGSLKQAADLGIEYVYVPENPGACEHCQRLVVGRVFPREALEGASNVGKKQQDWVAALPVHPNCTDHAIPASQWTVEQAMQNGPIPPEGTRIQFVPPSKRKR